MLLAFYLMIKRIIDISEEAYLHLKNRQLLIDKQGETIGQIPIEDLGVLLLQHPAITITQQVIIACQKNKVVLVFCDEKHLPYSVILPIAEGNNLHSKILKLQLNISEPMRKRLWQQIVREKIKQQAQTLELQGKNATRIHYLATKVKSGDSGNCESTAAQAYWKLLFGQQFKRDVDLAGINSLLNYGYAIIRAMIARAICGGGLHPTLGLFHQNQYNPLCLADDLMEPFRPWVDHLVYQMYENQQDDINQQSKQILLELLNQPVLYETRKMPFMIASHYLIAALKRCYANEQKSIHYPELTSKTSV